MVFFFWAGLAKRRYFSSRAPVLCGPQMTAIFHAISWASLKILPIWLNIFSCDIQLKREHQKRKHYLFCYTCMPHSQVPGYLIQCVPDKVFPGLEPSYLLSIVRAGHLLQRRPLMISPLFGIACFQKLAGTTYLWDLAFSSWVATQPANCWSYCEKEQTSIPPSSIPPSSLPRELVEKH